MGETRVGWMVIVTGQALGARPGRSTAKVSRRVS